MREKLSPCPQKTTTLKILSGETLFWYRRNTALLSPAEKMLIGVPNIKEAIKI